MSNQKESNYSEQLKAFAEELGVSLCECESEKDACEKLLGALGITPGPDEDIGIEAFEHLLCCGKEANDCESTH